jgi:hypothetical protein
MSPALNLFQHEGSPRKFAGGNQQALLLPPIDVLPRRSAG